MRKILIGALASASALAISAYAVTAQAAAGSSTDVGEVVVTGTLIHGKAPTGGEIATVTGADLTQLGVVDTSQLLAAVPQDSNFNSRPQVGNYGQYQSVNAPLLRNLAGGNSGSNSTLLLLDGVRMPGMGITQTSADIDAVAPGALSRVDIVPDGGSATYGADAVGGVVNLITRRKFDGLEVGGHFGGAANYGQYDLNATAGKSWDKASVWVSYDYTEHNSIQNHDRDYIHNLNYTTTPFTGNSAACYPGNFSAGKNTYPIVNGAPAAGAAHTCDTTGVNSFLPSESRHSVMIGFDYDITNWLTFDLRGYYMHRDATNEQQANGYTNVAATASVNGVPTNGTVSGLFGDPIMYGRGHTTLETYGVIPRFKAKLGHDWQLDGYVNIAEGKAGYQGQQTGGDESAAGLPAEVASGAFNPLTGTFANNALGQTARAYQAAFDDYSTGKDDIFNSRIVLDGPLFALPGGEVRAAVGGEYMHEQFQQQNAIVEASAIGTVPVHSDARVVWSGFGELNVPIVGEGNRIPGIDSLVFSAAGRYDDYSDFGSTFDPKLGLAWKPVEWWTVRGDWSRSFQAPSLASSAQAIPPTINAVPAGTFGVNPAFPTTKGLTILLLYPGGGQDLQPQKAITFEVGTDIRPPIVPGLSLSGTYYNIDFANRIATPSFFSSSFYALFPGSYIMNSPSAPFTTAQILNYLGNAQGLSQVQKYVNNPASVYALENALSQNLSITKTSGLDFNFNYTHPTSFGSFFGGVAGTYIFTYDTKKTALSVNQGLNANSVARLRTSTTLGVKWADVFNGDLLAKATFNTSGSYEIPASKNNFNQHQVSSLNLLNVVLAYTPKATEGALKGTTFTLNVDNLLDANPPYYNGSSGVGYGYAGFTLGRFVEVGATKKF